MQTPSISIYGAAAAVVALLVALLWYLSARRFRMASTSQELLDLFEDRQARVEEHAISTSLNDEGKAFKSATAAAPIDFVLKEDTLRKPFSQCFRLGRESDKPLVVSGLHSRKEEFRLQQRGLI